MLVGFCFIGRWCYSEWWVWDLITLAQFPGSEISPGLFQDFMGGYIKTLPISGGSYCCGYECEIESYG